MSYLLIVANTPSENTHKLRELVRKGAILSDFPCKTLNPLETKAEDVLNAKGLVIGTTENFGYMSGQVKDFFERIYYPCLERTQGLPWALYISAGKDGTGAMKSVESIVAGLRWRKTQEPLIV